MSLASRLKKIYTEGDQYTVLQLLNKLIKEIEDYEEEQGNKLYEHRLEIDDTTSAEIYLTVVNDKSEAMTESDVLAYFRNGGPIPIACTGFDDDHSVVYAAYTQGTQLVLKVNTGGGLSETSVDIDAVYDHIKEIN